MRELYLSLPDPGNLKPCPFCGSTAELWQYSPLPETYQKVVMCSNDGDEDNDIEPCPMHMPPDGFYKARKCEAIDIWNNRNESKKTT